MQCFPSRQSLVHDDDDQTDTAAITSKAAMTSSKKRPRNVSFQMNEHDEILCSVHVYAAIPAQCRRNVYWSKFELNQLRRERKACEATYSLCDDYVFSIERLLDSPLKCHLVQSSDLTEQQAVATLTQATHVRGLESRLSSLIQGHHRYAVRAVLTRHSQLRRDGVPHPEVLLRALSEQVSECNRDFAAKLAQGDRLEAIKVYQE